MKAKIWNYNRWISTTEPPVLRKEYEKMLKESGFKILNIHEHFFKPYGYTALFLLSESHFAIHTFPEENKTYIEISSCNKNFFEKFMEMDKKLMQEAL